MYYYNNIDSQTYTESEIKALYPNTSFPSPFVAPEEFSVVFDTPKPTVTDLQVAYQDGTEVDALGNRVVKWSVTDMFKDYIDELGVIHTKVEQEEAYLLSKRKDSVPTEIRMAQCRAQLIIDGKDDDVELLLNGIADPIQQKLYRAYFEYEPIVKRDNAMITEMAPALAIDLDMFFINASKL